MSSSETFLKILSSDNQSLWKKFFFQQKQVFEVAKKVSIQVTLIEFFVVRAFETKKFYASKTVARRQRPLSQQLELNYNLQIWNWEIPADCGCTL